MNTCSFQDCDASAVTKGLCSGHYSQMQRGKSLRPIRRYASFEERFWARVDTNGPHGCWNWTGTTHVRCGYGMVSMGSAEAGKAYAHRVSYQLVRGDIPEGVIIDHQCHNRKCVNPDHLRLSNLKLNNENRAGANKNSTSGVRGVYPNSKTGRWAVQITHNRRRYSGGTYLTVEEAERAAVALRNKFFTHNDVDRLAV